MSELAGKALVRHMNRVSVLKAVLEEKGIGRAEIAQRTGLSRASITSIAGELLDGGLLRESGEGKASSAGGRRPILLTLEPASMYAVALLLGSERTTIAIGDATAKVVYGQTFDSEYHGGPDDLASHLGERVDHAVRASGIDAAKVRGLAIGVPALVDSNTTLVNFSANLPVLNNVNLGHLMQRRTGFDTWVENETRLVAWGEKWYGAARSFPISVSVDISRGIGVGVIIGDRMLYGASHHAGQFGHMTVDQNGPLCGCGNRGCWETLASNAALLRTVARLLETNDSLLAADGLTVAGVIDAAKRGDRVATSAIVEIGNQLGIGIANIVNAVNPDAVIVHGDVTAAGDLLFSAIRNTVAGRALKMPTVHARILPSWLGDGAGIAGAIGTVVRRELLAPAPRPHEQVART